MADLNGIPQTKRVERAILLTGATGFIAAHVLDILLARGYHVKATVRSEEKGKALLSTRQSYKDQVTFAIVQDISQLGAFDDAMQGVDGVIHVASPFHFKVTDNEKDLLIPAINGTKSVLQAAAQHPRVKRVVITSSFASIFDGTKGLRPGYTYTSKDWCPLTYEEGKTTDQPTTAYRASKTLAEQTAWEFIEREKPQFDLVTLCPPMVFGPIVHPLKSLADLNTSNAQLWSLCNGSLKEVPDTRTPLWVDVRDVALAHVEAYERPEASNKRYALCAGKYSMQHAADVIRETFEWAKEQTPVGRPGAKEVDCYGLDASPAMTELGIRFRGFDEMLVETMGQLKKLQSVL